MSDNSGSGHGMSIVEAIAGSFFLLGFAVWATYSVITEGFGALGSGGEWWGVLIVLGLVVAAFVKGIKCLYSVFLHITKVSPEDRYWKEHDAEERIWKVVGGIIGFGIVGFVILISLERPYSSSPAVTTGEVIIIGLLIAVLYNQRRK